MIEAGQKMVGVDQGTAAWVAQGTLGAQYIQFHRCRFDSVGCGLSLLELLKEDISVSHRHPR